MHDKNELMRIIPEMKFGEELMGCLAEFPPYDSAIRGKSSTERLMALSDIYDIYIPSQMSAEIYHKLYMGLVRSLQKKRTLQAVRQQYENKRGTHGNTGIIGGSDSFTIIGVSGIGKSSALFRSLHLISKKEVIETENPYCKIAPCIIVQCPFDSSVKGLMLEILRKVDEVLESSYYKNALRARASTDMLIGSVSQVALNHIGLLVVDEIQNVVNSRNGKALVGMLTQLINNSGISICMVGTPESIPFFEQAMQLARRSLGLQYEAMGFGREFYDTCSILFRYQYTKQGLELTDEVLEWLFEHCGGNISVLVALLHDAQETAILSGRDIFDRQALEAAYKKRMLMLHDYLKPSIQRKKQFSDRRKTETKPDERKEKAAEKNEEFMYMCEGGQEESIPRLTELVKKAKEDGKDIVGVLKSCFCVEEVSV